MSGAAAPSRVCVVTGANKGIGLAVVRALLRRRCGPVYLTARDEARGAAAADRLRREGLQPEYHQLDVTDRDSILRFEEHVLREHGGIDVLINNAGVAAPEGAEDGTYEEAKHIVDVNYYSHLALEQLLHPAVRAGGRIVNVASDCGHLSNVRSARWLRALAAPDLSREDIDRFVRWFLASRRDGTFDPEDFADGGTLPAYRVSKVALCALTGLQQRELAARDISVNALHPGLVRTDMTRHVGFLTPAEAAETPAWLALDAPAALRGRYVWYDRSVLDWFDYEADYFFKSQKLFE